VWRQYLVVFLLMCPFVLPVTHLALADLHTHKEWGVMNFADLHEAFLRFTAECVL
jgi:hypothetical protein